jgi:hypothetical protein
MASLVGAGVFTLAMIVAAVRAAIVLPAGTRIPLHFGSVERCYLVPKRAGLVIWPAAGAGVSGVLGGIAASSLAADWVPGVRYVLTPAAAGVLLAFEVGALSMARRGSVPPAVPEGCGSGKPRPVPNNLVRVVPLGHRPKGRPHEDRQQSGPGNAGSAAR